MLISVTVRPATESELLVEAAKRKLAAMTESGSILCLYDDEFDALELAQKHAAAPTESIKRGAQLLRDLRKP